MSLSNFPQSPPSAKRRYDAIVVGGGIIGSLIAYTLCKVGLEIALLDAGFAGEATRASAGMLAPYPEGLDGELLAWAEESLGLYPDLVAELEEQTGVTIPFSLEGTGVIAADGQDLRSVWPSLVDRCLQGYRYAGGYVHPVRLKEALWHAIQKRGGQLFCDEAIEVTSNKVITHQTTLCAQHIVLAVGAWAQRFKFNVRPVKGEALWLNAIPPLIPLFVGEGYLLPREGGLYVGATQHEGWHPEVDLAGLKWLTSFICQHFPHLEQASIKALVWGYRPMGELRVGEVEDGIYAATGHGRNGVLLAPATAQRIAASILGVSQRRRI